MVPQRHLLNAQDWLRSLLRQIARLAVEDAQRLKTNHEVAVHALRVRMKKLRALLRLATDEPQRGAIGDASARAGEVKEGIAGLRDVHVMQRLIAKLDGKSLPIAPWVETPAWSAAKVLRKCRELEKAVTALPLHGLTWSAVERHFSRDAKRTRKSRQQCAKTHDGDAYHRWRKRTKTHYYQCLALKGAHDKTRRLKHLRKLGRMLGHEHDLTMLQGHLNHAASGAAEAHKRIERLRRGLHNKLERTAQRTR